jgi:hypothetical protein
MESFASKAPVAESKQGFSKLKGEDIYLLASISTCSIKGSSANK